MKIKYLENKNINFVRWDNCINNSLNGSAFAFSWYLNILCENWDALIMGNYEYVMPILHTKKHKHPVIFSSKLGKCLGIFTNSLLTEKIVSQFIKHLPKRYSFIHIIFNKFNKLTNKSASNLITYEIDLIQSYSAISQKYSNEFQNRIKIATDKQLKIVHGLMPNELINFSNRKDVITYPALDKEDYQKLRIILAHGLRYGLIEIHGVHNSENNLIAISVFLKSKHKIHVLCSATNLDGLKSNALHMVIDQFIETQSEKNLTLNIENIIIKNDLDFFIGVGAHECKYKQYYINKLPWYQKFLIKINE